MVSIDLRTWLHLNATKNGIKITQATGSMTVWLSCGGWKDMQKNFGNSLSQCVALTVVLCQMYFIHLMSQRLNGNSCDYDTMV